MISRVNGPLARLALAAALGVLCVTLPAAAQTVEPKTSAPAATPPTPARPPAAQPLNAEAFLRLVHSSAVLQTQAAELAGSRDTRPEVRAFAQKMAAFQREQGGKLLATAKTHMLAVPPLPEFEHRVILENLEPLDYLALSRRYAEIQVQALEQEVRMYEAGEASPDAWVKTFASEGKPALQKLLEEARQVRQIIGP